MSDAAQKAPHHQLYFYSIDGLRLIAAVNIVLFHLEGIGGLTNLGGNPGWLFRVIKAPAFHASLFFILGGFIFTVKFAHKAHTFDTRAFFWRRFKALYPLHVVTTLAMVPFVIMGAQGSVPVGKLLFSVFMHLSLLWSLFPFGSFSLNTPSWALSAFFFCYLFFGPLLRFVASLSQRRQVFAVCFVVMVPQVLWSLLYYSIDFNAEFYQFFHIFAPIRLFEFVLGMLLARLYQINSLGRKQNYVGGFFLSNDLLILGALSLIFWNAGLKSHLNPLIRWMSYHLFMIPPYALLLYYSARGYGLFTRFMAIPMIRLTGKSSFYPYLLHIPLISWICWVCDHGFGYKRFLHSPFNIALFVGLLYGFSFLYTYMKKLTRKRIGVESQNENIPIANRGIVQ